MAHRYEFAISFRQPSRNKSALTRHEGRTVTAVWSKTWAEP